MNSLKLIRHISSLTDISDIMSAMKYLSLMESNKLSRYIQHQKRAMRSIELAVEDFLDFYPTLIEQNNSNIKILVILGSERGFCGNYNELLHNAVEGDSDESFQVDSDTKIITVGYKLHHKFEQNPQLYQNLNGPRLAEEIPDIITELLTSISLFAQEQQAIQLTVLHHSADKYKPVLRKILPAFQEKKTHNATHSTPPLIHLSSTDLFYALLDEYLFALLNQIFYAAFMSENQYRIRHMENSLHKLSDNISSLALKRNEIRQEEITEELEVIMLSSNELENT